jgi:hypothetical protein
MVRKFGKRPWKPNPEIDVAIGREWWVSAGPRGGKNRRVFTPVTEAG